MLNNKYKLSNPKKIVDIIRSTAFAVLQLVVTMFFIMSVTFFIAHVIPGSPFYTERNSSDIVMDTIQHNSGLNENILLQYIEFLKQIISFDFGDSLVHSGVDVIELVFHAIVSSLKLGIVAVLFSVISVILLVRMISVTKKTKLFSSFFGVIGTTVPTFVFAILFQWLFCIELNISPPFWDGTAQGGIPAVFTISIYPTFYMSKIICDSLNVERKKLYCKVLRLKGIDKDYILFNHAMPNVIHKILGAAIPVYINTLAGSFIVEKVFAIPGIGWYFIQSISNRDYPTILGLTFFFSLFFIIVTITCDLIYTIIMINKR